MSTEHDDDTRPAVTTDTIIASLDRMEAKVRNNRIVTGVAVFVALVMTVQSIWGVIAIGKVEHNTRATLESSDLERALAERSACITDLRTEHDLTIADFVAALSSDDDPAAAVAGQEAAEVARKLRKIEELCPLPNPEP